MADSNHKVYIVSWNGIDTGGGVERVVGLLKRIIEKKYQVIVIDKAFVEKDRWLKKFCAMKNPVMPMILASISARKVMKKGDILIGNGFNAPFVKKDITFAHGCMYTYKIATGSYPWSGSTFFEKIAMRNSRRILPVSKEAQDALVRYYKVKKERTFAVNNCVDTDRFYPVNKEKGSGKPIILFCGRLEEAKGLSILLQLAKYIQERKDAELSIATPDSNNKELFFGMKNVQVHVGLSVDEMNQFYNSGHVLFMPSKFEGFEMVTLEALSSGVPVVGSRVGAIKELLDIKFDGVTEMSHGAVSEVFQQLIALADKYRFSMEERLVLHSKMKKKFGLDEYAGKILRELKNAAIN